MALLEDKNIITRPLQSTNKPKANFEQSDFFALIADHGYDVIFEKAQKCPCKGRNVEALSDCKNCGGSGWFFVNPTKTRMVVQAMSLNPQFQSWGAYSADTSSITANPNDKLSYMDRVTVLRAISEHSETLDLSMIETSPNVFVNYAYTIYPILSVYYVGLFYSSNQPIRKLETTEYSIENGNKLIISESVLSGLVEPTITIRYSHNPQYHIVEVVRDSITVKVKKGNMELDQIMPINARAKKVDIIKDKENFSGNRLFDNSFKVCEIEEAEVWWPKKIINKTVFVNRLLISSSINSHSVIL